MSVGLVIFCAEGAGLTGFVLWCLCLAGLFEVVVFLEGFRVLATEIPLQSNRSLRTRRIAG